MAAEWRLNSGLAFCTVPETCAPVSSDCALQHDQMMDETNRSQNGQDKLLLVLNKRGITITERCTEVCSMAAFAAKKKEGQRKGLPSRGPLAPKDHHSGCSLPGKLVLLATVLAYN